MPRVLFRIGPQSLEQELPVGSELEIGRSDAAGPLKLTPLATTGKQQLCAPIRTLSQQHAVLRVIDQERIEVEDCDSTNGTYLRIPPKAKVVITQDSELLLGRELTVRMASAGKQRARTLSEVSLDRPDELVKYLRSQLGPAVERVFISQSDQAERSAAVQQLRLPLITSEQLIVQWHSSTQDVETESWLRAIVSLYNSKHVDESTESKPWDFTAVSSGRKQALWLAKRVAQSGCTVLIRGATGTGKEVLASDLHNHSARANRPFVAVNCGAIHANLAESLLFGHARGSFTGATDARIGVFEQADGGTLFLDEIGELPLDIQVKLLRVLETRKVTPVGATKERAVDVRVIAATHRPLEAMIEQGQFREDLFYRLSTIQVPIPRLESEDVQALAKLFLGTFSQPPGTATTDMEHSKVAQLAASRSWVGGIRELRNALERYTLLRVPEQSIDDNWRFAMEASEGRASSVPRRTPMEPSAPLGPSSQVRSLAIPEKTSLAIRKPIDNLLFLSILQDALSSDPRVGISDIADRVNMTYQGVVNRLKSLELKLDGPDVTARIQHRIDEERSQLQPYNSWLKHCLQLD